MAKETTYKFSFIFDGDESLHDVLKNLIVERILSKKDEKSLSISPDERYNNAMVPVQSVSGSCKDGA